MDERLKLAESYYATARSLTAQGQHILQVADMLGRMADHMCEMAMQDKSRSENGRSDLGAAAHDGESTASPLQAGPAKAPSDSNVLSEGQPVSAGAKPE